MKTYNFEQAMEGVFHGIDVKRLGWLSEKVSDPSVLTAGLFYDVHDINDGFYDLTLDDFYAQDWVAYEGD